MQCEASPALVWQPRKTDFYHHHNHNHKSADCQKPRLSDGSSKRSEKDSGIYEIATRESRLDDNGDHVSISSRRSSTTSSGCSAHHGATGAATATTTPPAWENLVRASAERRVHTPPRNSALAHDVTARPQPDDGERSRASAKIPSPAETRFLIDRADDAVYEKRHFIGKGGFARVYEVVRRDATATRTYAAKVIDKARLKRQHQRAKVDIEIELLRAASDHPNIVGFHGSFEDDKSICILLELCARKSLAQYLRRKQSLDEAEAADIVAQVVDGLRHLHEQGILHRDLKLGNILLTDDMKVKIGDFGLATKVEWGKRRTICGTPNFIAPEVLQRQGHGPEADVWALGCLLFTLLVGRPPFETSCLRETYRCILKNSYRVPATVSPQAADLISAMLSHKARARPTLAEVAAHPFFRKNSPSQSLSSDDVTADVTRTPEEPQPCRMSSTSGKPDDDAALPSLSARLRRQSVTSPPPVTSSPVKSLADKLQKQLKKMASPSRGAGAARRKSADAAASKSSEACADGRTAKRQQQPSTLRGTWVTKWVDYSNRYGFGYQLNDGRICVLFNDGKHIALLPGSQTMEYAAAEKSRAVRFAHDNIPESLVRYVSTLKTFTGYMQSGDSPSSSCPGSSSADGGDVRMLTWSRSDDHVMMYMSDGTLQINFCRDHTKISVANLHRQSKMLITVLDQDKRITSFKRSCFHETAPAELRARMASIGTKFHELFFEIACGAHPFCGVCCSNPTHAALSSS